MFQSNHTARIDAVVAELTETLADVIMDQAVLEQQVAQLEAIFDLLMPPEQNASTSSSESSTGCNDDDMDIDDAESVASTNE
jgi:phage shock protein A